jgi:outer membrane protein, heavy metal efflux system
MGCHRTLRVLPLVIGLGLPAGAEPMAEPPGRPMSLEAALATAVAANPDLVALRQDAPASAEAVEVARRFPVALNPILWVNPRPWVYARDPGPGLNQKDVFLNLSLRQPIELGHQTRYREAIARAAYDQTRWTIVQAEVLALVQTYRSFQAAAYRREKLRLAGQLAAFQDRLVAALRRGLEAGSVGAADVSLAEVERAALGQQVEAARQDYASALADLRNQIGSPEAAGSAEPAGLFSLPDVIPPADEPGLIALALEGRPEIHAARARARGALAALGQAKGDRIPTVLAGPEYQTNESGTQFFGFVFSAPLPVLNNGAPLVRQRAADYRRAVVAAQQVERRTVAQVRAAVAKWDGARRLLARTDGLSGTLQAEVARVERPFQENQADLARLLQARQRLIQLENARLDALWQATQAQADLLTALGAPTLLATVRGAAYGPDGLEAR